jgi:hypothetical protein
VVHGMHPAETTLPLRPFVCSARSIQQISHSTSITRVHPEIGKFVRDQGARKI